MTARPMQVVILAGGRGTRLRPYTVTLPKPLVPVGDVPILEIVLRQLKRAGAGEIILSTGHMAELIRSYFGDGGKWGLSLRYAPEEKPLGTAGPLASIDGLEESFMVMNGDILTLMDFRALWQDHASSGAAATVAVCERSLVSDFGVVDVGPDGMLREYMEKPKQSWLVSMGINVLRRDALKQLRPGEALGMPDLLMRLKKAGQPVRCRTVREEWLDIGRPEDYEAAQERFARARGDYFPDA